MADVLFFDAWGGLWPEVEIDIVKIDVSQGFPDPEIVYSALKAYRTQKEIKVIEGPMLEAGRKLVDVFYVPATQNGESLGISETHQVRFESIDRKIIHAVDQGGQGQMIEIFAERNR